ncbi:MAG: hypothetical protein JXR94_01470 [Candidatus Hydrogenedentes bacterium]|nr:hypothetical protein [Candidatus Hydrogenedentota bacterium]
MQRKVLIAIAVVAAMALVPLGCSSDLPEEPGASAQGSAPPSAAEADRDAPVPAEPAASPPPEEEPDYDEPLPPDAPELQVTYEYADWSLPFLVAMKKGYFKKRGIDIKPMKVGDLPALRFSDMDIINGHAFSLMKESGATPRMVRFIHPFLYTKDGPMITGFLAKRAAGITKWSDFQGRTGIRLALISLGDFGLIEKVFEREGVDTEGIQCTCGGDPVKNFEEQEDIVGVYGWGGGIAELLERRPDDYILLGKNLRAEVLADPYFVACTYINVGSSRTKPEVIAKYIEAIDEAIDYIRANPERALAVVPKYMDFTPERAAKLSLYHFHKSTEPIDFDALQTCIEHDVRAYLYGSP